MPKQIPLLLLAEDKVSPRAISIWFKKYRPDFILARTEELPGLRAIIGPRNVGWGELSAKENSCSDGGIDEHSTQIGAIAVDLVTTQLQHNELGVPLRPTLTLVPGTWHWRNPPMQQQVALVNQHYPDEVS